MPGPGPGVRARVFSADEDSDDFRCACELGADDADEVWRQLEQDPTPAGRSLRPGDVT